jgi:hypothetical protein
MNKNTEHGVVAQALAASTNAAAEAVQQAIVDAIGARHERPVGDRWNNQGMLTASGSSFDHKLLEVVTNMQDAVIERLALQRFGSIERVPFTTPHAASRDLLGVLDKKQQAALATVTIDSNGQASKKRITVVLRDGGCGITPSDVPNTIFQIGAGHKDGVDWQQGTFGLGGATTYRNASAVVLVTRKPPELLEPGEEDRITVAVVQWLRHHTTVNAFYLTTRPWRKSGDDAPPFSVPASSFPDFQPGTHLALIDYATEGLARRSGDERSFDTVFNTRLYRPVMPISYRNNITRAERLETLDGLARRLDDNPGESGSEGRHELPFTLNGATYHLPMQFRIFSKPGEQGARRNFVAHGHALVVTSNGQVHSHWTPQDFKLRTTLNKLADRILVVVESDALPIELRTMLFTADRSQLVRTDAALRLEMEIASFLNDWPELRDANNALIRESIAGDNNARPTLELARKIARAMKAKGFALGGAGGSGGGRGKPPEPTPEEDLYNDPTHFEGPELVEAVTGRSKSVFFKLNAKNDFLGPNGRGHLEAICDHPDIGAEEITVGELRGGRVRVSIAIPETADLGTFQLCAVIPPWSKSSGGLGPEFAWDTKVEVVDEPTVKPTGKKESGDKKGTRGPGEGDLVALIWKSDEDEDGWSPNTVGVVEQVSARDLAEMRHEYAELADLDLDVPTIILNRTFSPLKAYIQARAAELTEEGKEQSRDRYAVGVGVALLMLDADRRASEKKGKAVDEQMLESANRASARAVLSVLPEYDRLAKELEE